MKDSLRNKCDLFADNYNKLYGKNKWNYAINSRFGALLYTAQDKEVDIEAIKHCRRVIKDNTGIFSQFKDTTLFMTSVMLSLQEEPETLIKEAVSIYNALKKEGFHSSPYLVLAALSIAMQTDPVNFPRIIETTKGYYDSMKQEHWFITSSDDYGFAALMAISELPINQAINEMECCYHILKQDFSHSNAVQALSHVLTFSDLDATDKCRRVTDLYEALKRRDCKFGSGSELSFLGVLALIKVDFHQLADEVAEVYEYLKDKQGFGYWSIAKRERIMFSIALVCDDYLLGIKTNTMEMTLAGNIAGILLAQQMAVIAAASASASAATVAAN